VYLGLSMGQWLRRTCSKGSRHSPNLCLKKMNILTGGVAPYKVCFCLFVFAGLGFVSLFLSVLLFFFFMVLGFELRVYTLSHSAS
jgi:hypothetical protein